MKKRSYLIIFIILLIFLLTYNNIDFSKITGFAIKSDFSKDDSSENNPTESDFTEMNDDFANSNSVDYTCPDCNVILIVIDTLRADHVGAYGYERDTTPNIDKLAEEGILFENMLAQSSWTKPSTASILTGLYPKNHGANTREDKLIDDNLLLSEILKKEGYDTHAFTANPSVGDTSGFNQGYDNFFELLYPDDYSDTVNDKLIPFIKNLEKTNKQFIYVHYMDPHNPYEPREKHFSKVNRKQLTRNSLEEIYTKKVKLREDPKLFQEIINQYDDEILFNDKMVGQVLKVLKEKGMYDNSVIVMLSDHGEEFQEHEGWLHGKTIYNEQLIVPWVLRLPGINATVIKEQVSHIEVLPTLLFHLNIPIPEKLDGTSVYEEDISPYIFSELNLDGNVFSSIQSLDEKLIIGATLKEELINLFSPVYSWFHQEAILDNLKGKIDLTILPFARELQVQITVGDNSPVTSPVQRGPININLEFTEPTDIKITSLTPCTRVSELGVMNDNRCLSFGVLEGQINNENPIYPLYSYFSLDDDPHEKNNLYFKDIHQKRVKELEFFLKKYIKEKKKRDSSLEKVQYTDEQLEALKALGYI